jgi:polyphosphate kinase
MLVVRNDYDGLRRYAYVATATTPAPHACTPTSVCSRDDAIGRDLTELFNYSPPATSRAKYQKLLVAPKMLKQALFRRSSARSRTSAGRARPHPVEAHHQRCRYRPALTPAAA